MWFSRVHFSNFAQHFSAFIFSLITFRLFSPLTANAPLKKCLFLCYFKSLFQDLSTRIHILWRIYVQNLQDKDRWGQSLNALRDLLPTSLTCFGPCPSLNFSCPLCLWIMWVQLQRTRWISLEYEVTNLRTFLCWRILCFCVGEYFYFILLNLELRQRSFASLLVLLSFYSSFMIITF